MNPIHKKMLVGPIGPEQSPVRSGWYLVENPGQDDYSYYTESDGIPNYRTPSSMVWRYWNDHCWMWLLKTTWYTATVKHGWYGQKETFPYTPAKRVDRNVLSKSLAGLGRGN